MAGTDDYGKYDTAWCPGCGNFSILDAVKRALVSADLKPHEVLFVSGIGQAAKSPHYLSANVFNGLHGRSVPVATGAKLANPSLEVIVESGDGCIYGEGGNHLLAAIRRNIGITMLVHDNQVYGLTKGQVSPTSEEGFVTKTQPGGSALDAFNPVAVAIAMHAGFVARGFSGDAEHLTDLIVRGIQHEGFALIDILQPCVSFNKVNSFKWYKDRCYRIDESHHPADWDSAMKLAYEWGDKIPIGLIYENERPSFEKRIGVSSNLPLIHSPFEKAALKKIIESYG